MRLEGVAINWVLLYDDFEENIEENNFEETEQFMNEKKLFKNRNNQGNYDNMKIPINDENLIKDIKNKEFNDTNYEDFEKRKTCEDFKDIGQLSEETLFKNVDNKKRCYEEKTDRNDTEELLNEK